VDFPIDSMVIFHSFLYVYQRVKRSGMTRVATDATDVPLSSKWLRLEKTGCIGLKHHLEVSKLVDPQWLDGLFHGKSWKILENHI
jgi:rhamnogalacturonyl hydrolase YesR